MPPSLLLLAPFGAVILATVVYLRGVGVQRAAARPWGWAWLIWWFSGASVLAPMASLQASGRALSTFACALVLAGCYGYSGRKVPIGLLRSAITVGVLAALASIVGFPRVGLAVGIFTEVTMLIAGGYVALRPRLPTQDSLAQHLLPGGLWLVALWHAASPFVLSSSADPTVPFLAWQTALVALMVLQLLAILDGLRRVQEELMLERDDHEADLQNERRLLAETIEASPDGILVTDRQENILLLNRRWCELLELSHADDWIGRPALELIEHCRSRLANDRPLLRALARLRLNPNAPIDRTELFFSKPQRWRRIESAMITTDDQKGLGRITVAHDITAEHHREHRNRRVHSLATVTTLSAGIAHDFNNQLTAILGNTRLAASKLEPESESQAALDNIERAASRCSSLTRSLLTFSQAAPPDIEAVCVRELLKTVETELRPEIPEAITLEVRVSEDVDHLLCDAGQLRQSIRNLVVNAVEAIGERGEVFVRAHIEHRHHPGSGAAWSQDWVVLTVDDDGCGIAPELLDRVFDPFFSTKPVGEGPGLGLSVVHGATRSQGGWVEASSAPGGGSSFRVLLEAVSSEANENEEPEALPQEEADQATAIQSNLILVADDEAPLRQLVRLVLEKHGYSVLEAEDGGRALELYNDHRADVALMLLDLSMPRLTGRQVAEAVHEQRPELPIILSSGHFGENGEGLGEAVGILPKPYSPDQLVQAIARRVG